VKFSEIIEQAGELLRRKGRITYRSLTLEFDLSDEQLDTLKEELLFSHPEIAEVEGRGLVWDSTAAAAEDDNLPPVSQTPASYTPRHLAERIRAEQAAMEARGVADGERKTITALFADLKGSTALIEGLDPEDARAIIDPALQLMMDAVHRYDGYVAQALGDGIFALFGAPLAHEDHPQRALYAALRMQEEMQGYSDHVRLKHGVPLHMRVGVNTGEVVVRSIRKDDLHTDYVPVGHSTNLAARMEQIAAPGSIVISEYTRKLTEGYFELKALGAADIKGVEEPLNVYEVRGVGPLRTRFQVTARRGLTQFVGRQSELDQMQRALEQARAGHGQIVGAMGEPGVGKSRLFYECQLASQRDCMLLQSFAVSHGQAIPYLPLIELLKHYFEITPEDDERKRREKITGKVLALDRNLEGTLAYLFALLGIEDATASLDQMDAQIRRRRTFDALKQLFLRESLNQPLILVLEDLHWIDTETQGFLDTLSESLDSLLSARLLLLVNFRPEYNHDWGTKTFYTQVRLLPLGKEEAGELLDFLLGNAEGLAALKQLILKKTEGTPFFIEEVVQTLVEEAALVGERGQYQLARQMTSLQIPATVQSILAARIDRLAGREKSVLQQLAVIGRMFSLELVRQVVSQPEDELALVLSALQAKEFLYEQLAFPELVYVFKHALTQDVAYTSVLLARRKVLHEQTARAIEALYETKLADYYGELARHYRHSGNTEKAVEYLGLAGHQATQRSASIEAVNCFSAALELLKAWPATPAQAQHELALQLGLGPPLLAIRSYAAPEVGQVHTRARELCHQLGDTSQLPSALFGSTLFHILRAELKTAQGTAEGLLALAQEEHDTDLFIEAYAVLGVSWLWRGELFQARLHLEEGIALYDPQQHRLHTQRYGQDPKMVSLTYLAWTLWLLGYPDQARHKAEEALVWGREVTHPFSLTFACVTTAAVYQFLGETRRTHEAAREALVLSQEHGFLWWEAWSRILRGKALAEQGDHEEGSQQIQRGLTAAQATGTEWGRSYFLTLFAETRRMSGDLVSGEAAMEQAFKALDGSEERWWETEVYRLRGELLLNDERGMMNAERGTREEQGQQDSAEAEKCFQHALDIARQKEAKSLELRAAMSLARLWQQQGKPREAHRLLSDIYHWFTEGFETADLQAAKTLLLELAESHVSRSV
jgi:class 3 adenylate cyclase/predicted ATPase